KYIVTPVKSGLMFIDQKRAHERILFEKYLQEHDCTKGNSQKSLYPVKVEMQTADYVILTEIMEDLHHLGFSISELGNNTIAINGCPADTNADPATLVENLLNQYKETQGDIKLSAKESLVKSLAKAMAINYGKSLNMEEMRILMDKLFACKSPNYSPDGKLVIFIMSLDEMEKKFK
ncbi:MAG: DNA mismatch repair protein MutL, partial [bacterium]